MTRGAAEAWQIDIDRFPRDGSTAEQLEFLLHYALLAPSGHNTQPWRFRIADERVEIRADRSRALPVVDPDDRELTISCGAALGHLEVCLRHFGHVPVVELLPDDDDPDLLARVGSGGRHDPSTLDAAVFEAIARRRTNRSAYADTPVPNELVQRCRQAAAGFGIELRAVADAAAKARVAELVAEGDRAQFADQCFRRELAAWIRSHRLGSRDGVSGAGFGMPDALSALGALVVRTFDLGDRVAAGDRDRIAAGSPCLLALASPDDKPPRWLETGRALSHVLLLLTADGFTAAYLNQPIEVEALRPRLRAALGLTGTPQLLLRAGRGPAVAPAARRPLDEVLIRD